LPLRFIEGETLDGRARPHHPPFQPRLTGRSDLR
jgi:hypothetical protein